MTIVRSRVTPTAIHPRMRRLSDITPMAIRSEVRLA
jgi:hypothetical protein